MLGRNCAPQSSLNLNGVLYFHRPGDPFIFLLSLILLSIFFSDSESKNNSYLLQKTSAPDTC